MYQDDKGRLIVSHEHGGLYRFPIPKLGEPVDPASIARIGRFKKLDANGDGKLTLEELKESVK